MKKQPWYLYIIRCVNGRLYTGIARDIEERFQKHKEGKGAKFTQRNKPKEIVYTEGFKTRSEASKREAEIKKMSKADKEKMIIEG